MLLAIIVSQRVIRTRRRGNDLFHAARGYIDPGQLLHCWRQILREKVRQIKQDLMQILLKRWVRLQQPTQNLEHSQPEIQP